MKVLNFQINFLDNYQFTLTLCKEMMLHIAPYYRVEVLDSGKVRIFSDSKHAKGRELSQFLNKDGYLKVKLSNKGTTVHSIVAKLFLGERPPGLTVNHKDCNKLNNHPSNLEYVSIAENLKHAIENKLHVCTSPEKLPKYKDGRCKDLKKYKREWYLKNRERILKKNQI